MFKVFLTNMGWDIGEFLSFKDAMTRARDTGFECTIFLDNEIVGTFSPITGEKSLMKNERTFA